MRIVTEQQGNFYTVSLYGRLAGEWVALLDRYWQSLVEKAPSARVRTVLADVSFIDAEGERLLERMWRGGVELMASGCMNRHVVDTLQGRSVSGEDRSTNAPSGAQRRESDGCPSSEAARGRARRRR